MPVLPEPPTAPAAGQATNPLTDAVIQAAIDNAIHEARRHGTSPPVSQRDMPAMSARTADFTRFSAGLIPILLIRGCGSTRSSRHSFGASPNWQTTFVSIRATSKMLVIEIVN